MRQKLIGTICLVLGIIIIVTTSTSFAYYSISVTGDPDEITGTIIDFDVDLNLEAKYHSQQLIPLEDGKILTAINNKCVDSKGYQVCSLYKVTLTNDGEPIVLNGYITSEEETTYITDNLRAQLINEGLTASISDKLILTNTEGKKYFMLDNTNLFSTEVITENVLYLAIWLTETHDYQYDDYNKDFYGKVAFESINGESITANFNS